MRGIAENAVDAELKLSEMQKSISNLESDQKVVEGLGEAVANYGKGGLVSAKSMKKLADQVKKT